MKENSVETKDEQENNTNSCVFFIGLQPKTTTKNMNASCNNWQSFTPQTFSESKITSIKICCNKQRTINLPGKISFFLGAKQKQSKIYTEVLLFNVHLCKINPCFFSDAAWRAQTEYSGLTTEQRRPNAQKTSASDFLLRSFCHLLQTYGGFLKWWYLTTMGFPTKNDHFGVFWGYHHLRKHPYHHIINLQQGSFDFFGRCNRKHHLNLQHVNGWHFCETNAVFSEHASKDIHRFVSSLIPPQNGKF